MVHESAAVGFERESQTYALARPSYPPELVAWLASEIDACTVSPTMVIDLGAGTGISSAALVRHGLDVVAVEPVEAMRTRLRTDLPTVTVLDGTAEAIPLATSAARTVVVAQAFHWFRHDQALDELWRVLAPGAFLVTLWNVKDESVDWVSRYTLLQDRFQGDTPRYRDMTWRRAIEADDRFELHAERAMANPQQSSPDLTIGRLLSTSFIAALAPAQQAEIESDIRAVVADLGDSYEFPYRCEAQLWRKLG